MKDKKGNMKVAIYVRVSTHKQEAENQLQHLRSYCENSQYNITEEYVDVISGKEKSRPAYDKLFNDAHKKKFDIVVFWDLSRFSRAGTLHTLNKLKELENEDIEWESYQEKYLRSMGEFRDVVISIMATLAKIERQQLSQRTKAGLERAKKEGKKLGRPGISNYQKRKIMKLYKKYGSINQVAKRVKPAYATCRKVIKNRGGNK